MILLDQASIRTDALTTSFGWNRPEERIQHDVQELNRILFNAIEQSLVGTCVASLISSLYGGKTVTVTQCQECAYESKREESFLDLTVPVAGFLDLQSSLAQYTMMEHLNGDNQYQCDVCTKKVDAQRGVRFSHLPSILTIGLNRFSYDWQAGVRRKENGLFKFSTILNMKPYCLEDLGLSDEMFLYDLYSVVIHSGSAGGGHYFAYIRDVYGEGKWNLSDETAASVVHSQNSLNSDSTGAKLAAKYEGPAILLHEILSNSPFGSVGDINMLSKAVKDLTGQTWKQNFKKFRGTIESFIHGNPDLYSVDAHGNVTLISHVSLSKNVSDVVMETSCGESLPTTSLPIGPWFCMNDSQVKAIRETMLEKQFQGKESAYMLFYSRRGLLQVL